MSNRRQQLFIVAGAVFALSTFSLALHPHSRQTVASYVSDKGAQWFPAVADYPCDPNKQPGYPDPWAWYWKTDNPACPGDNIRDELLQTPKDQLWDKFPEFRNKSLLIAGDSVGRHLAETICIDYLGQPLPNEYPPDFPFHYGWSSRCEVPELGLQVAMIHIYGMANASDPAVQAVLEKCYVGKDFDLQSRVHRWFNSTLKDFVPDFVQLNSGAWEYRYWYTRDMLLGQRHDDLPLADRETNARMAIQSMDFFKSLWPQAKVWYMHMSMMNEDDLVLKQAHGKDFLPKDKDPEKDESYPPLYTWRRQSQYRTTMKSMIAAAGYDSLDYVQIQSVMSRKDFSHPLDVIHPQYKAKRVMSSMIMHKIRRYGLYGV